MPLAEGSVESRVEERGREVKKILLEEEPGSGSWYCLVSREITAERRDLGHLELPLRHEKDKAANPLLFPLPLALTRATTLPLGFTSDTL